MLPAGNRMRRPAEFTSTVRGGSRARGRFLVVHHLPPGEMPETPAGTGPPIAGLIVGRTVGGSVVRNRVSRRLRAQLAQRMSALPDGSRTVVRALPPSATASSAELGADLRAGLQKVTAPRGSRRGPR